MGVSFISNYSVVVSPSSRAGIADMTNFEDRFDRVNIHGSYLREDIIGMDVLYLDGTILACGVLSRKALSPLLLINFIDLLP